MPTNYIVWNLVLIPTFGPVLIFYKPHSSGVVVHGGGVGFDVG